jgi:hypothetical protein
MGKLPLYAYLCIMSSHFLQFPFGGFYHTWQYIVI